MYSHIKHLGITIPIKRAEIEIFDYTFLLKNITSNFKPFFNIIKVSTLSSNKIEYFEFLLNFYIELFDFYKLLKKHDFVLNKNNNFTDLEKIVFGLSNQVKFKTWQECYWLILHSTSILVEHEQDLKIKFANIMYRFNLAIPCGICSENYKNNLINLKFAKNELAYAGIVFGSSVLTLFDIREIITKSKSLPVFPLEEFCKIFKIKITEIEIISVHFEKNGSLFNLNG